MPTPLRKRSSDFRYVYSNVFGMQLTSNEMIVTFGLAEDVSNPVESNLEQAAVILTLQSAKTLVTLIQTVLAKFEADNKVTIPMDDAKVQEILSALVAHRP